jgi:hypothetical protein
MLAAKVGEPVMSKKNFTRGMLIAAFAVSVGMSSAFAGDDTTPEQSAMQIARQKKEDAKLDKALVKYTRTGEMKQCLNPRRIRKSTVINDTHIIFEVSSRLVYLNTLPRRCSRLGYFKAMAYEVRGGTLCDRDPFEVFDTTGFQYGSCFFGEFEKLALKETDGPTSEKPTREKSGEE